jgi:hypothetical protein
LQECLPFRVAQGRHRWHRGQRRDFAPGNLSLDRRNLHGSGADNFVFSSIDDIGNYTVHSVSVYDVDFITDFNREHGDKINLHPIDADERASAPGNQDFSSVLISEGEAFTAPGEISWLHWGSDLLIALNTDADSFADATIHVHVEATMHVPGWDTPDASWFIF